MATPITWQNVNGPSLADALRPMEAAQRSFNGAFEGIGGLVKSREKVNDDNWLNTKLNRTNAALNKITAFSSPEEYAAAQKAGLLQTLVEGGQIDETAVRAAADSRLGVLQGRAEQGIRYDNMSRDQRESGIRDEIASMINSGNPALIAQGKQRLAEVQLRNEADLALAGNNASQQLVTRGYEAINQKQGTERHVADLKNQLFNQGIASRNAAVNEGQLAISQSNQKQNAAEFTLRKEEYAQKIRDGKFDQLGKLKTSTLDTKEGIEEAITMIGTLHKGNPRMIESLTNLVGDLSRERFTLKDKEGNPLLVNGKPQTIGISVAQAMAGIASAKDDRTFLGNWMNNKSTAGADIKSTILKSMDSPEAQDAAMTSYVMRQRLLNDIAKAGKTSLESSKAPISQATSKQEIQMIQDHLSKASGMTRSNPSTPIESAPVQNQVPVVVPSNGANVPAASADEIRARASEEAFKKSLLNSGVVVPKTVKVKTAAELKEEKKQAERELDRLMSYARTGGSGSR